MTTLPPGASLKARNVRRKKSEPSIPPAEIIAPPPKADSKALRIFRATVGVTLVVGIASTVAWGARHYVRTSPRFGVTEIITTGGKHRSPDELATTAGVSKGQNVFTLDLDRARAR